MIKIDTKLTYNPEKYSTLKELEKLCQQYEKDYQCWKVNLLRPGEGNEGIWCVPVDPISAARISSDNSFGEFILVRLFNVPLGWNGLSWGGLVLAMTQGSNRSSAELVNNQEQFLLEDREKLVALIQEWREANK